jgi:hypothetical protein
MAAALASLDAWMNTFNSYASTGSDVPHEHTIEARLIALEEDKAEMLALFQQISDEIAGGGSSFQAKSVAYVALQRYGKK